MDGLLTTNIGFMKVEVFMIDFIKTMNLAKEYASSINCFDYPKWYKDVICSIGYSEEQLIEFNRKLVQWKEEKNKPLIPIGNEINTLGWLADGGFRWIVFDSEGRNAIVAFVGVPEHEGCWETEPNLGYIDGEILKIFDRLLATKIDCPVSIIELLKNAGLDTTKY